MKKIIIIAGTILTGIIAWLAHRTEVDFGRVLNEQGDGKLYNGEAYYNYICYPDKYHTDDVIMTVCLLNPLNNYYDDIVVRTDFRLLTDAK